MSTISLFTPINYARPVSSKERILSRLSHYFYLGGVQVVVVKDNKIELKNEKIAWYKTALKVASYILFFPLTVLLLTTYLTLRSRYRFTSVTEASLSPYKYFKSLDVFTEVTQKAWYRQNTEIDIALGTFNSIAKRVNRNKFDNDFEAAKRTICNEIDQFTRDIDNRLYVDEINEFKQILVKLLGHVECNQNEILNQRKQQEIQVREEIKAKEAIQSNSSSNLKSTYTEVLKSEAYHGYTLYTYLEAPWTMFKLKESTSDNEKFHISLKRDLTNISNAFDVIFPILEKYKISMFKTLKPTYIDTKGGNPDGKEVVIYIQEEESNQELWSQKILPEILLGFERMNIQCGNPSQGDISVSGSKGFIYTRAPHNALGMYISTFHLQRWGFSQFESATISNYRWLNISINNAPPIQEKRIQLEAKNELTKVVSSEQREVVKVAFDEVFGDRSFFRMITGYPDTYLIWNHSAVGKLARKYGNDVGNFERDEVGEVLESATLKRELFADYFQAAASVTAQLRNYYGIQTPVGNIRPALYEHFIKNDEESISREKHIAIIKDLVLCALRNREVVPAQPVQVNDKLLRDLIEEAIG